MTHQKTYKTGPETHQRAAVPGTEGKEQRHVSERRVRAQQPDLDGNKHESDINVSNWFHALRHRRIPCGEQVMAPTMQSTETPEEASENGMRKLHRKSPWFVSVCFTSFHLSCNSAITTG